MRHLACRVLTFLVVCAVVMPIRYGDAQRGWRLYRQTDSFPACAEIVPTLTLLAQGGTTASGRWAMPRCDRRDYVAGLERDGTVAFIVCTPETCLTHPPSVPFAPEERVRLYRDGGNRRDLNSQDVPVSTAAYALVFPDPIFQEGKLGECMVADADGTPSWGVCR